MTKNSYTLFSVEISRDSFQLLNTVITTEEIGNSLACEADESYEMNLPRYNK